MPNPTEGDTKTPSVPVPGEKVKPVKISHNEWIDVYGNPWDPKTATRDVYGHRFLGQRRARPRRNRGGGGTSTVPTTAAPGTTTVDLGTSTIPIPETPEPTTPTPTEPGETPTGAPSWWNPTVFTNPNAEQQFANAANAILPSLSPEDQRNIANYLATNFKSVYGGYANATLPAIPTNITGLREQYLNPTRVQSTLSLLDKVQRAAGGTPGAGYDFLKNALGLMNKYTTAGSPMTREQYDQFVNAVKDMTSAGGNDVKAYSNLAQLFNLPNFTAGNFMSNVPVARLNL